MPFSKKINQDFIIKDNQIELTPDYLANHKKPFKKITGSRFASILGYSNYTTPAKTWAMMTSIYNEPMEELFAIAGNVIEPKIHKYVCQKLNTNYKQYNPVEIKWDVFHDNPVFGGIPDGEPINEKGELLYPQKPMLEIKTTSIDSFVYLKKNNLLVLQKDENGWPIVKEKNAKKTKWFDANNEIIIPVEYKFQLGLYCYLRNISHGVFAICFLETNDYIDPKNCDINKREVHIIDYVVDLQSFKKFIDYADKWYQKFIVKGVSPSLTAADWEWINSELK